MDVINNITKNITTCRRDAIIDYALNCFVPMGAKSQIEKQFKKGVICKITGKVWTKYGRDSYSRDERASINFIEIDNQFLWGRFLPVRIDYKIFKNTHEEQSFEFFGTKKWCEMLDDKFLEKIDNIAKIRKIADIYRSKNYGKKRHFIGFLNYFNNVRLENIEKCIEYTMEVDKYIQKRKSNWPIDYCRDCANYLIEMNLDLKTSFQLYEQHLDDQRTICTIKSKTLDFKLRSMRNYHDFLIAIHNRASNTTIKNGISNNVTYNQSLYDCPKDFEQIIEEKKLISVSRKYGWCSGQKYYRDLAESGKGIFYFSEKTQTLALYDYTGLLLQQKAPFNGFSSAAPNNLAISS